MLAQLVRYTLPPLVVLIGLAVYRFSQADAAGPAFSPPGDAPHHVAPRYDWPQVASDDQLREVLERLQPPATALNSSDVVHALRLWGPAAEFDDPARPSGRRLAEFFLDDRVFAEMTDGAPPLITLDAAGRVNLRPWERDDPHATSSSYHTDDALATMAESGFPLSTALRTPQGETTIGHWLQSSLDRAYLAQHEIDWTAISYARYYFPTRRWRNEFGETIDAAALVDRLVDPTWLAGACNGTHRLEALTVLQRIDETAHALPPAVRQKLLVHLKRVSLTLEQSQSPAGYWTRRWPEGAAARDAKPTDRYEGILTTGHHLEWLALAPPEVLPPRETIIRAAQWLVRALADEDPQRLVERYGPCSHAARALCLWRGGEAYDTWLRLRSPAEHN